MNLSSVGLDLDGYNDITLTLERLASPNVLTSSTYKIYKTALAIRKSCLMYSVVTAILGSTMTKRLVFVGFSAPASYWLPGISAGSITRFTVKCTVAF